MVALPWRVIAPGGCHGRIRALTRSSKHPSSHKEAERNHHLAPFTAPQAVISRGEGQREREKQAPEGLDPRTLGSGPELRADA